MRLFILILFLTIASVVPSIQAQPAQKKGGKSLQNTVRVMYFHGARRCNTCKAIEKVAKNSVKDQYEGNPRVVFKALNHEEEKNAALVEKYQIAGSSLIVQGPGSEFKDLTAEAFQFAARDPGKLQALVISTVDGYLK